MPTLEALRRTVGGKTGMTYDASGTDQTLIDAWLNEGVREVLIRTHCYTAASFVTTTADEWQYDLSSNVMVIKMIWRDGETAPMVRVTPEEILELRRTSSATDDDVLRWAIVGTNMLMFWPTPSEAYDIQFVYVPRPTEMSSAEHDPSNPIYGGIPTEYHKAIELFALANASDHEHEQGTDRGLRYLAQFDEYVKRSVLPGVNRKGGGSMPRARVGRRVRPIGSRNDTWPG